MKLIRDIGIDLGTANVLCYEEGRGIVLREPSVVAVDKNTGKVLQVGSAARNMLGEAQPFVPQVYPARLSVFGLKIFSAGTLSGARCEVEHNPETGVFRKLFYNEAGCLAGCILVGDLRDALKLQNQIAVS